MGEYEQQRIAELLESFDINKKDSWLTMSIEHSTSQLVGAIEAVVSELNTINSTLNDMNSNLTN
jgi:hypothetical protein